MTEHGYELVIAFEDQSPSFAHGFEAGRVWQQFKDRKPYITDTVSHDNAELYSQMAARSDYILELKDIGDGWMTLRAEFREGSATDD